MTLATLKNYLDITWQDAATDTKLSGILERAESILSDYAGKAIDFSDEATPEAQLLLDCCRYIYNHALEDFKVNFAAELLMLRAERQASDYGGDDAEEPGADV